MDLVANVKRVVVLMDHVAKDGSPKFVDQCAFPLTGASVVDRLITDLGVFDIEEGRAYLVLKHEKVSLEEIKSKTTASFSIRL